MRPLLFALVLALSAGACGDGGSSTAPSGGSSGVPNKTGTSSSTSSSGSSGTPGDDDDDAGKPKPDAGPSGPATVRILAGNLSTGNQTYDLGEGTRILQGLKPDIALIQEVNVGTNSPDDVRGWVTTTFGADYTYFRESGAGLKIPNAVVSRFPILESGRWADTAPDRGFVYAKIEVPGGRPLWAISVHLLTANPGARDSSAKALVSQIKKVTAPGDYVVVGGDFNTDNRSEPCLTTFAELLDTKAPHPADADGDGDTNAPRGKPYDWVIASPDLVTHQVPTILGTSSFANGLVFDSRVYTPLSDVAPVKASDSAAEFMQHMAVVKDFGL